MALAGDHGVLWVLAAAAVGFIVVEAASRIENLRARKIIIICISSALIIWLDLFSFVLLVSMTALSYAMIKRGVNIKAHLPVFVPAAILMLVAIKDYGVLLDIQRPYVPLGVSYYFFRLISAIIDYSNQGGRLRNTGLLDFFAYALFFPIFLAGPIQRINDFRELDRKYVENNRHRFYGMALAAIAVKLVLIDGVLFKAVYETGIYKVRYIADSGSADAMLLVKVSGFGVLAFLHAYLDLMLYTETSKAFSRILGFEVQENFNRPLLAPNISNFWQRWHISLSNWTRDYVFFPALLKTRSIWHSATASWIFWALAHATMINLYGEFRKTGAYAAMQATKLRRGFMRVSGTMLTVYFVSAIFVVVAVQDLGRAGRVFLMSVRNLF